MQLGCMYVSHMCRVGKPCQKSEFTRRVGKPSRGWKALSKISPAGVGKPCQKSEFTCRVGKPGSNLYLQNPRGGGASLHPTEATMEEVHWKYRNSTTSCGQEPCAAYICVFQYVFWVMVPMPFSPGSGHHHQDLGKAQDLWPESLKRFKEPLGSLDSSI